MTTAWKNSHFISSERSDFQMVDNLSTVLHALSIHMLTSLSVDEILLTNEKKVRIFDFHEI